MTCEEAINELQAIKDMFCGTPIKAVILAKIKVKLKVLVCCDEDYGGATTTTTTTTTTSTTTTTTTTTEEVTTTTTSTTSTSTTTVEELPLRLLFNDIENTPVADPSDVADWNTFFDLPTWGTPFTSVQVTGNEVGLFGATSVQLKDALFLANTDLVSVIDEATCVVYAGGQVFEGCSSATGFVFPALTMIGGGCFVGCSSVVVFSFLSLQTFSGNLIFLNCSSATTFDFPALTSDLGFQNYNGCTSATLFNLPLCTTFGSTTGDDGMFFNISGNTITVNVPASLATADGGNPDGDLVALLAANPGSTINYI